MRQAAYGVIFALFRYEIVRELAPYIGFVWERKVGRTADLARGGGEAFDTSAFVAGVRFWF